MKWHIVRTIVYSLPEKLLIVRDERFQRSKGLAAHALALDTHRVACRIRGANNSGLRTQSIRAAMSVPANIVESRGQFTCREECRYLRMALNSATELEYHLLTARDIRAISGDECATLTGQLVEVRRMLYGLIRSLSNRGDPDKSRDQ